MAWVAALGVAGAALAGAPAGAAEERAERDGVRTPVSFVDPAERARPTRSLGAVPAHQPRDPVATREPVDPDSLRAEPVPPRPQPPIGPDGTPRPDPAYERWEAARARYEAALAAYRNMTSRNSPRGGARAAIVAERDAARAELEEAERALSAARRSASR